MPLDDHATSRRRFVAYFSSLGLSSSLLPGVLWEKLHAQEGGRADATPKRITDEMLVAALAVAELELTAAERAQMLSGVNSSADRYVERSQVTIDQSIPPPMYFSPLVPGTKLDRVARPFRMSHPPTLRRPATLEQVAFWPVQHLAQLVSTKQVTSVELTEMYLARLKKYAPQLNCVVTFTDALAMAQAAQADKEIAAGKYRGPLHGIPWGCKDIIAVPGYPTTWGSNAFRNQMFEHEATVVRLLREAGAVLIAKLATGEMASGEYWFGGRINNPYDLEEGASGSSGGPASATSSGLVGFSIGTDTGGSVLFPATRCGAVGLRPTFGRVSRHGAMTLSWTRDRVGPICRSVEDCAIVFNVIAKPDEEDLTVMDLPFNWDAALDVRTLRVGYLEPTGADEGRTDEWTRNDHQTLDALRSLGVTLEPFTLPKMPLAQAGSAGSAESGAFFEELMRHGRDEDLTNKGRRNGLRQSRLVPAVEYLQAQRIRAMLMRQFAGVVSRFDVYLAPSNNPPLNPPGRSDGGGGVVPRSAPNLTRDHHDVSNTCALPAVSVPNGFTSNGTPTSITFHGRLYNEAGVLALARAYQATTKWHERHPPFAS